MTTQERICTTCGKRKSKRWRNVRKGPLQCQSCYEQARQRKATHEMRARYVEWLGE